MRFQLHFVISYLLQLNSARPISNHPARYNPLVRTYGVMSLVRTYYQGVLLRTYYVTT